MPETATRADVQRLMLEESAQLVEVLPPAEFEDEHIAGAINIPLKTLGGESTRSLARDRPVVVY